MSGHKGVSPFPHRGPLATPDTVRDNPEHYDEVARLAREAARQAPDRKSRRSWKRAAQAAETSAARLRRAQQ